MNLVYCYGCLSIFVVTILSRCLRSTSTDVPDRSTLALPFKKKKKCRVLGTATDSSYSAETITTAINNVLLLQTNTALLIFIVADVPVVDLIAYVLV